MRFVVVGTSGSGKTTLAMAIAARLQIARVELDELHWLPNWVERRTEEFRALVSEAIESDRWVVDGNYDVVQDVVWPKATDIVWLNFRRATVFGRVLKRTLRRSWTRETLWAGNRETLRKAFMSRESILLWVLTTYGKYRVKYARLRVDPALGHLRWHELRTPDDARRFLLALGESAPSAGSDEAQPRGAAAPIPPHP